jgi:hypothetical protein
MNKLDLLASIVLNEAPLSSYVKSIGSKVLNPAAYARGAGKVLRGAGQAVGGLTTSTKSLAGAMGGAGNVATGIGTGLSKTGQWLKSPGTDSTIQTKKQQRQQQQQPTQQSQKSAQTQIGDLSKTKTQLVINNTSLQVKYIGSIGGNYPTYNVKGIPWAKSVVVEPVGKNRARIYFYKDKKPNTKKPPAVIRPGSIDYSGVQNSMVITTK